MMINQQLVNQIIREINLLETAYQQNQGMLLTEDDLKCQLFARIWNIIPQSMPTINTGVTGSPLHSEVKFFDENGKLLLVPDITIISPDHLSIFHSVEFKIDNNTFGGFKKFSSKNFEIGGNSIIMELKFCRDKDGLNKRHILSYQQDVDKIRRLQELVWNRSNAHDRVYGIFVVFNKTDAGRERFDEFYQRNVDLSYHPLSMVYKTGNVDFTKVSSSPYDTGFITQKMRIC